MIALSNLESPPKSAGLVRAFVRAGVREARVAALAQLVGVVFFVSAAVIYGLQNPASEIQRSVASPVDYQLTPTPTNTLPRDKPAAIVEGEVQTAQIISALKHEMKSAQAGSNYGAAEVEFVDDGKTRGNLSLNEVDTLPPKDLLGRTFDFAPTALFTIPADSVDEAKEAAAKLIAQANTTPTQPFAVILRLASKASDSWPASFGLIKTSSRLLFTDEKFKISEVFTSLP
jgi:hypothetical protein